jgi:hypothetical protein
MSAIDLDAQEGFVAAVNMAAPAVVDLVDAESAPVAGQAGPMRCNNNTSGFVLRRMA